MILKYFFPSPPLQSIVHRYDYFSSGKIDSMKDWFFFTPHFDNGFLFLFYKDRPVLIKNELLNNVPLPTAHWTPTLRIPTLLTNYKDLSALRVTFKPGAISKLYQISLHACPNIILELGYTLDKELNFLYEKLLENMDPKLQVLEIEKYLMKKLKKTNCKESKLFNGLNYYLSQNGYTTSVKGLAKELGFSIRGFNRHLNKEIGISATEFIRIHRLNTALKYFQRSPEISMTQVAYKTDYYDQAHFIRDFKRMTGHTPRAYLKSIDKENLIPMSYSDYS